MKLSSFLESHPGIIVVHGTLTDDEPCMGLSRNNYLAQEIADLFKTNTELISNEYFYMNPNKRLKHWTEKMDYAIKNTPHIACNFFGMDYDDDLWSPVGLVVTEGVITDLGYLSKVKYNGDRVVVEDGEKLQPLQEKLENFKYYGEILIKDPVFSSVYVKKNHEYTMNSPVLINLAKAQSKIHGLNFILL